jgi:hypothetical protein
MISQHRSSRSDYMIWDPGAYSLGEGEERGAITRSVLAAERRRPEPVPAGRGIVRLTSWHTLRGGWS